MTAEECIKLLREIKDVAFATVDKEGHPQVRIIDVMIRGRKAVFLYGKRERLLPTADGK